MWRRVPAVISLLMFALAACAPMNSLAPAGPAPAATGPYRLGAGDKLRISTFGEEKLSGEFVVDGAGLVSLPLIGSQKAGGLTAQELQSNIAAALRDGYLKDPRVSVEVLTYRPIYILGEVNRPGAYPYSEGMTVLSAVATAQGFTYRANTKRAFIKAEGEAAERSTPLTAATPVKPGDTIRIGERFF